MLLRHEPVTDRRAIALLCFMLPEADQDSHILSFLCEKTVPDGNVSVERVSGMFRREEGIARREGEICLQRIPSGSRSVPEGEMDMSQILVTDLTFGYEGSSDFVFENVSFAVDTAWRLGFIGRNGKGKTTFLRLLLGEYEFGGRISSSAVFDYFPYLLTEKQLSQCASEWLCEVKPGSEQWQVICELARLNADADLLYRPFHTLSQGERTKVLLALLFSGENHFCLIDEPTNHLDQESREVVKQYLKKKRGFILVSHDRDLLDACIDHVLVLNRKTIEVQSGNFSSWWENKQGQDHFARMENEKHLREISAMKKAADQTGRWAEKSENSKIGLDPVKDHDRCIGSRAYIGEKTRKLQSRVKQYKKRMEREIAAREDLLVDIENPVPLKLNPLSYHKDLLVFGKKLEIGYEGSPEAVLKDFSFELRRGERVFLHGGNGCGKSTLIKTLLISAQESGKGVPGRCSERSPEKGTPGIRSGQLQCGSGLIVSYVSQDTSFLSGGIREFCQSRGLDEGLFCTLLRKLDLDRVQFTKNMEEFSEGQKKKVLLAASLIKPAHLYLWDEPLNYIDVFSRMQIEELLLSCRPTMLIIEHDVRFREKIATRVIGL